QGDAYRWAVTLLGEGRVGEIAELLDEGDEYRRQDALARLRSLKSPEAAAAVQKYEREYKTFLSACAEELRRAGVPVAEIRDNSIRLESSGPLWLNMPMFYSQRRSPTFAADFVRRAKELLALNEKR